MDIDAEIDQINAALKKSVEQRNKVHFETEQWTVYDKEVHRLTDILIALIRKRSGKE